MQGLLMQGRCDCDMISECVKLNDLDAFLECTNLLTWSAEPGKGVS